MEHTRWRLYIVSSSIILFVCVTLFGSMLAYGYHGSFEESLERYVPGYAEIEVERSYQRLPVASSTPEALRIPIFIYHNVRPDYFGETRSQKAFSITPALFETQLTYLHDNGYTTITMDQLAIDLREGTTSSLKPVVLSFDDGWKDQYTYAFPLLKKYHDVATFYIYTKPISSYPAFLTWEQIKEMNVAGMEIGSHTLTHPYLSKLTPGQMKTEIFESKTILEQHLGHPILHFASPYGYTSPQLVALLQEAGYQTGRTTYKGAYHSQVDTMRLTGFLVHNTMRDFEWDLHVAP